VETGFAGSFRPCSVGCVAWVVRSCHGGGLCRPRMMMALKAPSFPLVMLVAWSPGWLLARLRVGILNFAPPSFCGDKSSAKNVSPGRGCACPVSGSIVPSSGYSCPAPRGGSRAAQAMPWELSFAFFVGSCVCCKVVGAFPCSYCRALSAGFFFCKFPIFWTSCCWPIPLLAGTNPGTFLRRSLGFAFVIGCVDCRMSGPEVAWGVDSRRSCRLLLPACS